MKTFNPFTEAPIAEYRRHSEAQVQQRIDAAHDRFLTWRRTPIAERTARLRQLAEVLRHSNDEASALMTAEMGKPISQSRSEVDKCAKACDFYADRAADLLAPDHRRTEAQSSYVRFDALGVVLGIMPWNFPLWQVLRFGVPALLSGNVVLLKHATAVTGCALLLERLFHEAGFSGGAFTTLLISAAETGAVIDHPAVRGVSLTGSEAAGRSVAERAGRQLKKCVLELGGSDPFLVLADADVLAAARAAATARLINCGQSCIAAKRFLVEAPVYPAFVQALIAEMQSRKVGDPSDPDTEVGPLARADLREDLQRQVEQSVAAGAVCELGGHRTLGPGYFFPPTVLTGVGPGMPAFDDELFGPVAAVLSVRDADHGVRLANQSRFGLGASIWTRDIPLAERIAGELEAGSVFINDFTRSDPRMPFGGVRDSGYGRELSEFGVREFQNIKSVWIA